MSQNISSLIPALALMENQVGWKACLMVHHMALAEFTTTYASCLISTLKLEPSQDLILLVKSCLKLTIRRSGENVMDSSGSLRLFFCHILQRIESDNILGEKSVWTLLTLDMRVELIQEIIQVSISTAQFSTLENWLIVSSLLSTVSAQWDVFMSLPESVMALVSCITESLQNAIPGGKVIRACQPWILLFLLCISQKSQILKRQCHDSLNDFYKLSSPHSGSLHDRLVRFLSGLPFDNAPEWRRTLSSLLLNASEVYLDSIEQRQDWIWMRFVL